MKNQSLLLLVLLSAFHCLHAQSLYPVSFDEKADNANLIIEGQVISRSSFWNPGHSMIFTSNKVAVSKLFKGDVPTDTIQIITVGGSVGADAVEASDLLQLAEGESGIFFCTPNNLSLKGAASQEILYDVYASSQGFLKYDLHTEKASAPFESFSNITDELYPRIIQKTGQAYRDLRPAFKVRTSSKQQQPMAVSITGFSPSVVHAGALLDPANNLLTITGSGFGLPGGSAAIRFDDADNGTGGTPISIGYASPLVVSWTDLQIQVRVPAKAGTGTFEVVDAAGSSGTSPGNLTVQYAVLNSAFTIGPSSYVKESNLMNANGSGGYSIVYSTSTAGSGVDFNASTAKSTFQRALTTWKEISGYNVTEAGTTTTQLIAGDGENIVMFDNSNTGTGPLPSGVLAVCYSYNSMCTSDPTNYQARKTGFDIVVRNSGYSTGSASFTMGPCPPNASNYLEVDLETVILHELGHSLNLGHINDGTSGSTVGQINPGKLMNFSVTNSVKRVSPDYSAKAGASYLITPQGNSYGNCTAANTEMTMLATISESKDECPGTFPVSPTPQNTSVYFDLVHATSNKFVDPSYLQVRCDGNGASITNNAYYAFQTSNGGGPLLLSVSGYTTTPSALGGCTQIYANVPVTGVRLAIYQANSCPAAGSFGAPVACQTFAADGSLPAINGLAANTNYLLIVEGIENTKASFNLVFSGAALPLQLTEFRGEVLEHHNRIYWKAGMIQDVERLVVQRSGTGSVFEDLAQVTEPVSFANGAVDDPAPYMKTFYRLRIVNHDGSADYSDIIAMERNDRNIIRVYPNPARENLHVQLNAMPDVQHTLLLLNSLGQQVYRLEMKPQVSNAIIPVQHLPEGIYQLVIHANDQLKQSVKLIISR